MANVIDLIPIKFEGHEYKVVPGEIFQAWVNDGVPNTTYEIVNDDGVKVTIKVLMKSSPRISLVQVKAVDWPDWFEYHITIDGNEYKSVQHEDVDFNKMTKKEMVAYIMKHNIDIDVKKKKKDILEDLINMTY